MKIQELKFLHQLLQQISEKKPLDQLLGEMMTGSKALMHAEASSLLLTNASTNELDFYVATGKKSALLKQSTVAMGSGIAGWVALHKQPLIIDDCYKDPRFNSDYDAKNNFKTKSMICVPMIHKEDLLGVIQVINKKNGSVFTEDDLLLLETLASQCAIAITNHQLVQQQIETEILERALETAREIQERLLPSRLPEYPDIDVAACLIPAKQVGGDYYNVIQLDDQTSYFFVADATGKGIPAALIVSTMHACLNSYLKLNANSFDLLALVQAMNEVLIESTTETKFAAGWFGLYHHDTQLLESVNAGHDAPILFMDGQSSPIRLNKGGLFLGSLPLPYEVEKIQLTANTCLIVYTDGITEAWNEKQEDYGEPRFLATIQSCLHESSDRILENIKTDINWYVGKMPQSDDLTCLVVKIH